MYSITCILFTQKYVNTERILLAFIHLFIPDVSPDPLVAIYISCIYSFWHILIYFRDSEALVKWF